MTEPVAFPSYALPNGLTAELQDTTRHYYGGYWHVAIDVRCVVPVEASLFDDPAAFETARKTLGEQHLFVRRLEKMAVRQDLLAETRQELLERFERTLLPFLSNEQFPFRFLVSELEQRRKKVSRGIPCLS